MTEDLPFVVRLYPSGLQATVDAPTVIAAAEIVRDAYGPANEAIVRRADNPKHLILARVYFDVRPVAVHFVGFRGEEYWSAVKLWGQPDFYHRVWDQRAQREIAPWDVVVFAKYGPDWRPSPYNYDDSNEDGDPAKDERRKMR